MGLPVECFIELINVPDTTAETITRHIISTLESRGIDPAKIMWIAFDGSLLLFFVSRDSTFVLCEAELCAK